MQASTTCMCRAPYMATPCVVVAIEVGNASIEVGNASIGVSSGGIGVGNASSVETSLLLAQFMTFITTVHMLSQV